MYELSTKKGWQEDNKQKVTLIVLLVTLGVIHLLWNTTYLSTHSYNPQIILDSPSKTFVPMREPIVIWFFRRASAADGNLNATLKTREQ